jgi:leader peptidase (prepilin peptidase) / N-methyltransferase
MAIIQNQLPYLTFFIGALVGSFLNVVILRLPEPEESIVFPSSRCPKCKKNLKWYDNIPILSFIILRRQCRYCHNKISWQYPIVELSMALLSLALFLKFELSIEFFIYFLFTSSLLSVIVIDLYHQIIPDVISLPGIIIGFAFSFINPFLTWQESAIGVFIGGGILYAIAFGYYLFTRREGMGGGDIKLLAMIGAFLGWQSIPFVIFTSSLTGTIAGIGAMIRQKKGGQSRIPFGPFLVTASYLYIFYKIEILNWFYHTYFPYR